MGHAHHHHHSTSKIKRTKLFITIVLNVLITLAQVVGGFISGSLSLISDALHNFSDVVSLVVSYVANRVSKKEASTSRTFGYKRAEIIAAFINAATLIIVALLLIKEAIERFFNPQEIASNIVIWLALLGIFTNGFSVLLLKKEAASNLNMKSAYLHLLTDMMASVAVLFGGLLMKFYELYWVDAALTIVIAIYLIYMGFDLLKTSTKVLMLFTPENMEVQKIVNTISKIKPIKNIHHVHLWQLNEDEIHLEAHINFSKDIKLSEFDAILEEIEETVYNEYGINHISIQPEFAKCETNDIITQD